MEGFDSLLLVQHVFGVQWFLFVAELYTEGICRFVNTDFFILSL